MKFDTKIAVILSSTLATWQKLNVTAFTVSGIASNPEVIGAPYEDASGNVYMPMIKQPIMIFSASAEQLKRAYQGALQNALSLSIFTEELFATRHDDENRAVVKSTTSENLNLVGIAVRGPKKTLDSLLKGYALHP